MSSLSFLMLIHGDKRYRLYTPSDSTRKQLAEVDRACSSAILCRAVKGWSEQQVASEPRSHDYGLPAAYYVPSHPLPSLEIFTQLSYTVKYAKFPLLHPPTSMHIQFTEKSKFGTPVIRSIIRVISASNLKDSGWAPQVQTTRLPPLLKGAARVDPTDNYLPAFFLSFRLSCYLYHTGKNVDLNQSQTRICAHSLFIHQYSFYTQKAHSSRFKISGCRFLRLCHSTTYTYGQMPQVSFLAQNANLPLVILPDSYLVLFQTLPNWMGIIEDVVHLLQTASARLDESQIYNKDAYRVDDEI